MNDTEKRRREIEATAGRLRALNAELVAALELFLKQWNACGPNSDFGRYFSNVRVASETALAKAKACPEGTRRENP